MPKLHLVGITPDHRGLVLSEHARAKRGDMVLEIDDRLLEAIEKAQRLRLRDEGQRLESNALPTKRELVNGENGVSGRLSPREIQQRLRAGESVAALARSSGTDEAWIRRFAAPVLAEQAEVIERARGLIFAKRGVGPSAAALGAAVAANVIDRGVPLTLPDLEAGWGAYQHPEGGWRVTFTFPLRGRRQTADWEIDLANGELIARNKLAAELGWRESGKKLPQPKPAKAPAAKAARPGGARPAAGPDTASSPAEPQEATSSEVASAEPALSDAAPSTEAAAASVPAGGSEPGDAASSGHTVQALPLSEKADPLPPGVVREVSLRKPRKPPRAPKATGDEPAAKPSAKPPSTTKPAAPASKRAAAAVTETPAQTVAAVQPEPAASDASPTSDAGEAAAEASMPPTDLDAVDVVVDIAALEEETAREPAPVGSPPAPQGGPPAP